MKVDRIVLLGTVAALAVCPIGVQAAATPAEFASGLLTPNKIVLTPDGNLLVTEAGPLGTNLGRVSLVERSGDRRTLLDKLPSGIELEGAPSGPTGLWVSGHNVLYLEIGQGDVIKRGAGGGEVPNPEGLGSPLFSSLLRIQFGDPISCLRGSFELTAAEHQALADGRTVLMTNSFGERASVKVVADLRDLYPVPAGPPGAPPNPNKVSGSNPYGLARLGDDFYLPDAGQNSLVRIDRASGRIRTLLRFPPVPNPQFPVGPPMTDAVPNSVRRLPRRNALLVTLFTGFPFNPGQSSIQLVDPRAGTAVPFITGLTMAIDILPIGDSRGPFLVLEFASGFDLGTGFTFPGRVLSYAHNTSTPELVASGLVSPTSMVFDQHTREIFVTEIFTGRIMRIAP
jgi:hypothetical protein